jgi:glycosyltransferase involved in cell wall biosynthesis
MKVAIFTDNDFGKINGVTTTLTAVLDHAPTDIQPRIFTAAALGSDYPNYLAYRSIGVGIPFYREMKMYVPYWRRYLDRVVRDGVDVIHLTTPGPLGLVALWVAAQASLPLVGSFHTDLVAYTRLLSGSTQLAALMREYMRWMYGRCAQVMVPSEATRELMLNARMPAARLRLWPRGVDTALFAPGKRSEQLRSEWRVSDRRPALLYVGRLSKEKGLSLLPLLQDALRARGLNHQLIVAGEGPMQRELVDQCHDAIFTGPLNREDVARVFASSDVFVFPSETDTAGNVVLEAQSSGLPVVVSDQGGPKENLAVGLSGFVCSGQDPGVWADVIAPLFSDHGLRGSAAARARQYALARQWDLALSPLYEAYRDVGARRRPRAA